MTPKQRVEPVLSGLREAIPSPQTELNYSDPFQLLVAVILSAQCTDERVNLVTPDLFESLPTAAAMAEVEPEEVFPFISSVTYPNNKSKHLVGAARTIMDEFDGEVPDDVPELMKLPGVGRKTAQVVAGVVFERDTLPVDTHVFRVANRIGLARDASTPLAVERQLKKIIPRGDWAEAHHLLILHGRYTCIARSPKCSQCNIRDWCLYYERLQRLPESRDGLDRKKGAFHCATCKRYFDAPDTKTDRYGMTQAACPSCRSMNLFETRRGRTTKRIPDFRVG